MKKSGCLALLCLLVNFSYAQPYDFSSVDNLFNNNSGLFNGQVVCMVKHRNTLIYYKEMGGIDSTSNALIASVTKTFAGLAILKLAQEGLLKLDDSLGMYKPKATTYGKGATTIRQNFSHTGGWSGNTTFDEDNTLTLQQAVDSIIKNDPLINEPGEKFNYSGVSMHVAGAVAEIVTGQDWNTIFSTEIASQLNLNNSSFCFGQNNPRVAGGMCSNPSDLMKLGDFIANNGKNNLGTQVIDSIWMSELWKDQTNRAPQLRQVYPFSPANNNPYNADTIYYGLGTWLDIYNPITQYQEQISADGAFGSVVWVNRCTNITGVIFTKFPTQFVRVFSLWHQIMDIFRNSVPNACSGVLGVDTSEKAYQPYPNPTKGVIQIAGINGLLKRVDVFNLKGDMVAENCVVNDDNQIDISALSEGVYILKIVTNNQVDFKKVLLQK